VRKKNQGKEAKSWSEGDRRRRKNLETKKAEANRNSRREGGRKLERRSRKEEKGHRNRD
jgi:hypothetical protein